MPPAPSRITVEAGPDGPARFLVLGGAPFGEQIVMWWNFIGRSHDEVVGFREDWQRERSRARRGRMPPRQPGARYGTFPEAWDAHPPGPRPAQPEAPLPRLTGGFGVGPRSGEGWAHARDDDPCPR